MATMRPQTILLPRRIDPMFIIDGNGGSLVNGNDIGDGKHFYCAKCMSVVPCACIRPCFSMCDHDFCSSCVAMKLPHNVARLKCTGESSTASEKYRGVTILRPETVQVPSRIDPMFITDGNEGSPVNDISDSKRFYCAKCMHVVPCACIRYNFTMCDHDFCSRCVAMKLRQNVARVKCTGESSTASEEYRSVTMLQPGTVQLPSRINPMFITDGNGCSPVNDISDSKRFYCAKCMHVVPCACMRYNFTMCDHDFCSRCVAMKLRQNVARVKCTGESSTASEEYRSVTMLQPGTVQLPSRIDPMFITDGNEGSPVNDISDSKRFYCAKCMHVVPCACMRYNFTMCDHDFCSRCVAMKLRQNVARVKCTGESSTASEEYRSVTMLQPETVLVSSRIAPLSITDGNEDSPVDNITDGKLFFCAKCLHVVPCACIRSNFTTCDRDFCSRCVGLKLCQNVPRVKCTVDNSTVAERYHSMAMVRPETAVSSRIDPNFVTGGNEDSPLVDGNDTGDDKHFYCAKCMHVVPCACIRSNFRTCNHDFCSRCVAVKLGQNIAHVGYSEGEDGDDDLFYCNICMEMVARTLKFSVNSCGHVFCSSCITQYVAAKLDNNVARVECLDPGCKGGVVELERCHDIIPPDLLDKWGFLLCESVLGTKRIYCPYRECSAPLLADSEAGVTAVTEAECPHCHRLFCVRCAVPWHGGITCNEFQKLGLDERGPEDILLRRLVGREGWQRCPKCQMYVEKSEGCNYIKCRCGYSFCYRCASKLSALNHFCNKCKR
uniref:RBR-type E3 ubiquitin transferase n=2 Tax=Triticum urartu TaxID=4572 RepID=A0A8R7PLB9_TRIUA